jgi:cytochrome c553
LRFVSARWKTLFSDNRSRNLAALCQRCHMRHDACEHRRRRWLNAFRVRAIGDLFA